MALYNTVIAGGFGLFILLLFIIPDLDELVRWRGLDGATSSLLIPLFLSLGGYTFFYRNQPVKLKPVFIIQIIYKPVALLLLIVFSLQGLVHRVWTVLIAVALIIYIIGYGMTLRSFE